ncbi:hypothetical protein SUGI_0896810 [Cryptomeria japonica]|nr:hypothetical protein SUGI_0896810 [Cryptomeria japonica]
MEELEATSEKLRSLEREVNELSRERRAKMEELEGARQKVTALEEQNRQILQDKDAAVKRLQGYLDSRSRIESSYSVSSSNKSLTFSKYSWNDLKAATEDFFDRFKLGEGGYGAVYKGEIKETRVAVKIISEEGLQGLLEFRIEMNLLSEIRYPN